MAHAPVAQVALANAHRQLPDERRAAPRYEPEPLVPVLFGHRDAETPAAGLIADVSLGGCRLIAAPNSRPMLHWGDPFRLVVSYSEASRSSGIEGLRLAAHVVRIVADAKGLMVHSQFTVDGADGEWRRLVEWVQGLADGQGSPV